MLQKVALKTGVLPRQISGGLSRLTLTCQKPLEMIAMLCSVKPLGLRFLCCTSYRIGEPEHSKRPKVVALSLVLALSDSSTTS